jgi:hypothetical protein
MKTSHPFDRHTAFIDYLSAEAIAITGRGIYVYLNPLEIEQLFEQYQSTTPLQDFARRCVRATLALLPSC